LSQLRIGKIPYTNTWPISHFFNPEKFNNEIEFIPQVPSQLNKHMAEGLIDIGPISSFAYAEHADKYFLLPDLSVSAYGNVGSISLFVETSIEDLKNKRIALTNTSATSINLLKIIIQEFLGGNPEYITMSPNIELMLDNADAALLIGDDALLAGLDKEISKHYKIIDLGEEWRKRTNHWMTFAVWAIRKEVLEANTELVQRVYQEFIHSKEEAKKNPDSIIYASIEMYGGSYQFWRSYFEGLSHDFKEKQIAGLSHYFKLANKIGVLSEVPEIEVVNFEKAELYYSFK